MEVLKLPQELVDSLCAVHWKTAIYPKTLRPLLLSELQCRHDCGGGAEWVGVTGLDWTIARLVDPVTWESLPVTGGTKLQPGVRIEFACRAEASITGCPLFEEDLEMLQAMSLGDVLERDIEVECLSRCGRPALGECADKVLQGSVLLGAVADRYTFQYEPIQRIQRNLGKVHELAHMVSLDVFRFRKAVCWPRMVADEACEESCQQCSCRPTSFSVVALASRTSGKVVGRAFHTSVLTLEQARSAATWKLRWSPPDSFKAMAGDLCVMFGADNDLAARAAHLFSGHARVVIKSPGEHRHGPGPLLQWMVALVFQNPVSDKCTRQNISEDEAMDIFKNCFKPLAAGIGHADYLKTRCNDFKEAFRSIPRSSAELRPGIFRNTVRASTQDQLIRPYGMPGTANLIPCAVLCHDECSKEWWREQTVPPRCFLELLQRTIIDELIGTCELAVQTCYSQDEDHFLVLVTCDKERLLREAERLKFHAELDLQAVDPESLEPCTPDFEPLLHTFFARLSDPHYCDAEELLEHYQRVVQTIESEWADSTEAFRSRFRRARAFWLAGSLAVVNSAWELWTSVARPEASRVKVQVQTAFLEYLSLRAEHGITPHARLLMREACSSLHPTRCGTLTTLLRLWSPLVEGWSRVLWNHWDWFAGGMKQGEAMAFCSKRPGMDWASFRPFEAETCGSQVGSIALPFCSKDQLRLILSLIHRGLYVEELMDAGCLQDFIALDSADKASGLERIWKLPDSLGAVQYVLWFLRGLLEPPPTDEINRYYSSRIAFYFELTKHFVLYLFMLGLLGLILLLLRFIRTRLGLEPYGTVDIAFAVAMPVWSVVVLSLWKQREAWLVAHWGRSADSVHAIRPAFWGFPRRSPTAVGQLEITFPLVYRNGLLGRLPRQMLSCFLLAVVVFVEFACSVGITILRRETKNRVLGMGLPATMMVWGQLGYYLSRRLTEWENYPTGSRFIGNMALKISVFEFCNRYGILFYIAFGKAFWEGCIIRRQQYAPKCTSLRDCEMCTEELQEYVAVVMGSSLALSFTQLLFPLTWKMTAVEWCQAIKASMCGKKKEPVKEEDGNEWVDEGTRLARSVSENMAFQTYGDPEVDGSFDDYLVALVTFGYAALFTLAFPAAPLVSALALLVELRVDGVKIYNLLRRPFPIPANGLESWMQIFQALVVFAVVGNAALAVWTFRILGGEETVGRWLRFLGLLVGTSVLMALAQIMPCLHLGEGVLPLQLRVSRLAEQLVDSLAGAPPPPKRGSELSPPPSHSLEHLEVADPDEHPGVTDPEEPIDQQDVIVAVDPVCAADGEHPGGAATEAGSDSAPFPSREQQPKELPPWLDGAFSCLLPPHLGRQVVGCWSVQPLRGNTRSELLSVDAGT